MVMAQRLRLMICWDYLLAWVLFKLDPTKGIGQNLVAQRKMMLCAFYLIHTTFYSNPWITIGKQWLASLSLDSVQTPFVYIHGPEKNVVSEFFSSAL